MRIGIIGAMQMEVDALQAAMESPASVTVSGITFVTGRIGKHDIVAAQCGIGKVFAAMCAQTMILKYAPEAIINIGVAGSVTKGLQVLDIAIADKVCQHDMDTSPIGDPVGLISGINQIFFPADPKLIGVIEEAAKMKDCRTVIGTVASGDQFIHTQEQKTFIRETFGASAAEMEGGSIGHVCTVNNVPFAILRTISDGDGAAMDYAEFATKAALQSIEVIMEALKLL